MARASWIAGAVLGVLATAGAALLWRTRVRRAALARSWATLSSCLVGAPLAPGEALEARVRSVPVAETPPVRDEDAASPLPRRYRVGVFDTLGRARATAPDRHQWPTRCAEYALEVRADADAAGRGSLAREAQRTADALERGALPVRLGELFREAAPLERAPVPDGVPHARVAPRPLLGDDLVARMSRAFPPGFTLRERARDGQPGGAVTAWFGGTRHCTFGPPGLSRLACGDIAPPYLYAPEYVPVPHDAPALFAGPLAGAPDVAVRTLEGRTVAQLAGVSRAGQQLVYVDGDAVTIVERVVSPGALTYRAARFRGGARAGEVALRAPTPDQLIVAGHLVERAGSTLVARRIVPGNEVLGPEVVLATGADRAWLRACTNSQGGVLAAMRSSGDPRPLSAYHPDGTTIDLYFVTPEGFSAPVRVPLDARRDHGYVGFACRRDEASLSWASSGLDVLGDVHDVHVVRCTPRGCVGRRGRASALRTSVGTSGGWSSALYVASPAVVDLGERTLLVWSGAGAIWARVAPLDGIDRAPNRLLFAQPDPTQPTVALRDAELVTRDDAAVLLLVANPGAASAVYPVRVGPDGAIDALLPP